MELTPAVLRNLNTGFRANFQRGFAGVESQWKRVATMVPSSTSAEDYAWIGEWPKLREWIGDRQVKGLSEYDYTIKNKDFEATVSVKRNKIEDDQFGIYAPMFEEMGRAAAEHPDELVFAQLAAGFSTPCYDGQYFFDTDHPVGGASISNMQAGAGSPWYLLDTKRALKPLIWQKRKDYNFVSLTSETDENVFHRKEFIYGVDGRSNTGYGFWQMAFGSKAALDAANFDAAMTAGMQLQSDEGRKLGIKYNLLVTGAANRAAARSLLEVAKLANGADNPNFKEVEVLIVPWLP